MAREMDTDVIIGGGGMVGLTLALALAQGGLKVVVADPVPVASAVAPAFDGRVSALSYSSIRMLRALGVWRRLEDDAQPIKDILVTDAAVGRVPSPLSLHFDHREIGQPMGCIVENRHIRAALFAAVAASKAIVLRASASFVDLETQFQLWRFRHLRTVQRIIGFRRGTGGSSGVSFLKKALELEFFPELFEVRTTLQPRGA